MVDALLVTKCSDVLGQRRLRILVTGATGFVGRAVTETLVAAGQDGHINIVNTDTLEMKCGRRIHFGTINHLEVFDGVIYSTSFDTQLKATHISEVCLD